MFQDILTQIEPALTNLLCVLITALCGFACAYIKKKADKVKAQLDNEKANIYVDMASRVVTQCVEATHQTYVEALKKDKAFTKEAQEKAFNQTLDNVKTIISNETLEGLKTITDDVEGYLTSLIESRVKCLKDW